MLPEVRRALPGDTPALARLLARAFLEDPVADFVFPDRHRRAELLRRFFVLQIGTNYLPRGEVYTTDDRLSAALWLPPDVRPPRRREQLARLPFFLSAPRRQQAMQRLGRFLVQRHPTRPRHYYLGTLGTDPAAQGRGLASALLRPVLARCDDRDLGVYLECSKAETVPFYRHHGFRVLEEVEVPGGGPRLWLMWRDSRPPETEGLSLRAMGGWPEPPEGSGPRRR